MKVNKQCNDSGVPTQCNLVIYTTHESSRLILTNPMNYIPFSGTRLVI